MQTVLNPISMIRALQTYLRGYILRHTHASYLAMAGVPMAVIARQLGHDVGFSACVDFQSLSLEGEKLEKNLLHWRR